MTRKQRGNKMKKLIKISILLMILFYLSGCDVNEPEYVVDYIPPVVPTGVEVVVGDDRIDLYWNENRDPDLAGYNIYFSYSYDGEYHIIGSSPYNYFIDEEAVNGNKYYYAVTAYDYNGNESDLSLDVIYATARPEGFNQAIFDFRRFPNNSGYSFPLYSVVAFDSIDVDFFFENYEGTFYLDVWDDTDIQDMGPTDNIYDIPYAPTTGWSSTKDVFAKVGHTYVIWTWDNHYAKIRVSNITNERVVFDWAYQIVEGERQLKPTANGSREPLEKVWNR
jgi:hypothetical protein